MWLIQWMTPHPRTKVYLRKRKVKNRLKRGPRSFSKIPTWMTPHQFMTYFPEDAAGYYKKEAAEVEAFALVARFPELLGRVSVVWWNGARNVRP